MIRILWVFSFLWVFGNYVCVIAGDDERPEDHFCPMSRRVFIDPVVAEDGQTYEREEISKWFRKCLASGKPVTSPITEDSLFTTVLIPNHRLKSIVSSWGSTHPRSDIYRQTDIDHPVPTLAIRSIDPSQEWPIIGVFNSSEPRGLAANMRLAKTNLEGNRAFVTLGFKINKKNEFTDHAYLVIENLNGSIVELTGIHVAGDDGCCGRVVDVKVRKEGDTNNKRQLVLDKFLGEGSEQPTYKKFRSFVVTQSRIDSVLSKVEHDSIGNFYYGSPAWGKSENCCTYIYSLLSLCGVGFENEKKFKKAYFYRDGENLREFIENLERDRKIVCHIPCTTDMIGDALTAL